MPASESGCSLIIEGNVNRTSSKTKQENQSVVSLSCIQLGISALFGAHTGQQLLVKKYLG